VQSAGSGRGPKTTGVGSCASTALVTRAGECPRSVNVPATKKRSFSRFIKDSFTRATALNEVNTLLAATALEWGLTVGIGGVGTQHLSKSGEDIR
jgi:hypothetical protein